MILAHPNRLVLHCRHSYGLAADQAPASAFTREARRKDDFIFEFFDERLKGADLKSLSICVDVTGFMRPHMFYLVHYHAAKGVKKVDVIYAEPGH